MDKKKQETTFKSKVCNMTKKFEKNKKKNYIIYIKN